MFTNVTYRIKGMLLIGSFVFALLAFLLFGSFFSVNETPGVASGLVIVVLGILSVLCYMSAFGTFSVLHCIGTKERIVTKMSGVGNFRSFRLLRSPAILANSLLRQ